MEICLDISDSILSFFVISDSAHREGEVGEGSVKPMLSEGE